MTATTETATGTWTTDVKVLRDGPELVLYLTVRHKETGERYAAMRRGNGVRFMATQPLSAQLDWIEETVTEGNWKANAALRMARELAK